VWTSQRHGRVGRWRDVMKVERRVFDDTEREEKGENLPKLNGSKIIIQSST